MVNWTVPALRTHTEQLNVRDLNPTATVGLTNWSLNLDCTMDKDLVDHVHHLHCKPPHRKHSVNTDTRAFATNSNCTRRTDGGDSPAINRSVSSRTPGPHTGQTHVFMHVYMKSCWQQLVTTDKKCPCTRETRFFIEYFRTIFFRLGWNVSGTFWLAMTKDLIRNLLIIINNRWERLKVPVEGAMLALATCLQREKIKYIWTKNIFSQVVYEEWIQNILSARGNNRKIHYYICTIRFNSI